MAEITWKSKALGNLTVAPHSFFWCLGHHHSISMCQLRAVGRNKKGRWTVCDANIHHPVAAATDPPAQVNLEASVVASVSFCQLLGSPYCWRRRRRRTAHGLKWWGWPGQLARQGIAWFRDSFRFYGAFPEASLTQNSQTAQGGTNKLTFKDEYFASLQQRQGQSCFPCFCQHHLRLVALQMREIENINRSCGRRTSHSCLFFQASAPNN